jgi:hypothetical protein
VPSQLNNNFNDFSNLTDFHYFKFSQQNYKHLTSNTIWSEAYYFKRGKIYHEYLTAFVALKFMTDGHEKTHHQWKETYHPDHDPAVTTDICGIMFQM